MAKVTVMPRYKSPTGREFAPMGIYSRSAAQENRLRRRKREAFVQPETYAKRRIFWCIVLVSFLLAGVAALLG